MARRYGTGESRVSVRKHLIIKEMQAAIARQLAVEAEVPKTVPQRIAELLRELHRRLREAGQKTASSTEATPTHDGGASHIRPQRE